MELGSVITCVFIINYCWPVFRIPLGGGIQSRAVKVKLGGVFIYLLVSNSGNDY